MDITLAIAIIGCVIGVTSFFFARKDKGEKDMGDSSYKMGQIQAKIDMVSEQITRLSDKFDRYDSEVDDKINKAIENHIKAYHSKGN